MSKLPFVAGPVDAEFAEPLFGDARLDARLELVVALMAAAPAASLPMVSTSAQLEGAYRFLANERVTAAKILTPHTNATWNRAKAAVAAGLPLLSIEDTTEVRFGGKSPREGLGMVSNGGQGFFLHPAMLVTLTPAPVPLGIAHHEVAVRTEKRKDPNNWAKTRVDPERQSLRWGRVAHAVDVAAAVHELSVIHVADREADDYEYLGPLALAGSRFVVRLAKNRNVTSTLEGELVPARRPLDDTMKCATGVLKREVPVSRRSHGQSRERKAARPREARVATLSFKATRLELVPPNVSQCKEPIEINVVDVVEPAPPPGQEPIHWRLGTTEPISTKEEIAAVVDMYRARWLIEEYFKALKTGCSIEERQMENFSGLYKMLALTIPIAWHMLLMRAVVRDAPDTPAKQILSPLQLAALELIRDQPSLNRMGVKLGRRITAEDALYAVGRMGGHLKHNGTPGWLTLRRGVDKLREILPFVVVIKGM